MCPTVTLTVEVLAGATIEQGDLAGMVETRKIEHVLDIRLLGAVEHRRRNRHAVTQIGAELDEALLVQRLDGLVLAVDLAQQFLERLRIVLAVVEIDGMPDLQAEAGAGPAQMGLQDLADIHPARHAERIEHDVDRRTVGEERHVLERHDLRHHALVAVAAGHLVAGLDLALHGDEDLDHLHDAGRQFVAALQLLDLIEEALFQPLLQFVVLLTDGFDLRHDLVVRRSEQPPLRTRILFQDRARDLGIFLEALRPGDALAPFQEFGEAAIDVAVEDRLLIVAVLGEPLDFFTLDGERAFVLVDTVAIEHAHFDDRALHARRHPQ